MSIAPFYDAKKDLSPFPYPIVNCPVTKCWMGKIPVIAYCRGMEQGFAVINRITPLVKPKK